LHGSDSESYADEEEDCGGGVSEDDGIFPGGITIIAEDMATGDDVAM
jgi:hypothetical protein